MKRHVDQTTQIDTRLFENRENLRHLIAYAAKTHMILDLIRGEVAKAASRLTKPQQEQLQSDLFESFAIADEHAEKFAACKAKCIQLVVPPAMACLPSHGLPATEAGLVTFGVRRKTELVPNKARN